MRHNRASNIATYAATVGLPIVASQLSNPYILEQAAKVVVPAAGYHAIDEASKNMGYEGVENGIVQNVLPENTPNVIKRGAEVALAYTPFATVVKGQKISKTLGELVDDFYSHAQNSYAHYANKLKSNAVVHRIKNKNFNKPQEFIPKMFTKGAIGHVPEELGHTYKVFVDPRTDETKVALKTFSGKDMGYAGDKVGAEIALMNAVGSSDARAVYIPMQYQQLMSNNNNFNNMSSLMALKRNLGIDGSFENVTEQNIRDIYHLG